MFNIFVPNINEVLSALTLLFLILTFYTNGLLISNKKDFNINFVIGWSLFSFSYIFFGAILNFGLNYITIFYSIFSLIIILISLKKVNYRKIQFYLFLIPIFFLFLSSKSHGYDSFAFILNKVTYLINNNEFPIEQFRSNYPFSSNLIHYFSNFYVKNFTQNIPALFELILIIGSIEIFIKITKKKINSVFLNLFIISLIIILFNPMIMNVYSFSSYEDFHVAYVLLVIFYFNYENNFDLIKILEKKITYVLLLSLLSVSKSTGFIHVWTILFSNFIIYAYFNKINFTVIKKLLMVSFFCFSQFLLWQYHILSSDIYTGNDFQGFRAKIFNNIFINYYNQFLIKKFLLFSNFIFILSGFFIFFIKKNSNIIKILIFVSIPVFFWNLFHMIFFIFIQGYDHAIEFHNFFRYLSQFSMIFTLIYFIVVIENVDKNYILKLKSAPLTLLLLISLYGIFFIYLDKFRRDLSKEYEIVQNLDEKKFLKILNNKNDISNLDKVIINFYKQNYNLLLK